jgi:hypothetical protein
MMGLIGELGETYQNAIYGDFDAEDFAWLDGAAGFDLAGMMAGNFDFFSQMMDPEEALGLFGSLGGNLTDVVQGLAPTDLAFLDGAEDFDLGGFLGTLDDDMLAGFMEGWGTEELQYLDGLASFDLAGAMGEFDPDVLMGLMTGWEGPSNLEYLANLEGFDFDALMGANPDEMMGLIGELGETYQNAIYGDFDAEDFAWLDGAAGFDLAGMMAGNFDFFSQMMDPEEALGLFGSLGGNLTDVVQGLAPTDLAFLDGAEDFDLGGFLGTLDDDMLAGFMEGWGTEELQYLDGLGEFDLGEAMSGFDPDIFGSMMAAWDDPNAVGFLGALDGFDIGTMLNQMPEDMVGDLLGELDDSMLDMLGGLGGDFDVNDWIAGAGDFVPPDFDWGGYVPPEGMPPGTMPGGPGTLPIETNIDPDPVVMPGGPGTLPMPPMTTAVFGVDVTDYLAMGIM